MLVEVKLNCFETLGINTALFSEDKKEGFFPEVGSFERRNIKMSVHQTEINDPAEILRPQA